MMTNDKRIEALESLGYARREAEFLCLAALHSGYFLRRQYRAFLSAKPGYVDDLLTAKLVNLGHGRVMTPSRKIQVCHIFSRPFYAAIGEQDNRHRRIRPPLAIKAKLMALDHVLSNPDATYLATEAEKVAYFLRQPGITRECLPAKTYKSKTTSATTERYFVDKFPISTASVVSFCYIDEGSVATPAFETWIAQYSRLFLCLPGFRVVYVSTRETGFSRAEKEFRRFFNTPPAPSALRSATDVGKVLRYFRLEELFRSGDFRTLDAAKLDELRRLRKQFEGERVDALMRTWREQGDQAVVCFFEGKGPVSPPENVEFATCTLPWDYEVFDTWLDRKNGSYGGQRQKIPADPNI